MPNDFYDGFVSVNLLDFSTGLAIDFFVSNECFATVYARLPFPGAQAPDDDATKYFALFKEQPLPKGEQQTHRYKITYNHGTDELFFYVEGELVNHEVNVPKMDSFIAALGMMTEKDIVDGKSVSCHGQGLTAEWSPLTITKRLVRSLQYTVRSSVASSISDSRRALKQPPGVRGSRPGVQPNLHRRASIVSAAFERSTRSARWLSRSFVAATLTKTRPRPLTGWNVSSHALPLLMPA